MRIRHLYISSGHSFFGRHGQSPAEFPMREVAEIECVAESGIRGDRFFDYKPDFKGQITFFAMEIYEALGKELGVKDKSPWVFRRNVITEGKDLNELIGQEYEVQGVRFLGMAECSPCEWMDQAFASGAQKFLHGRGGLRAKILSDGKLRVDAA